MRCAAMMVFALLLTVTGVVADEEAAKYFTERGEKALSAKEYEPARKHFEKALSEHAEYLPAVLGLARTAAAEKKTEDAIGFLETCLEIADRKKLSEAEEEVRNRAEEMLKKLDRARFEYRSLVSEYIEKVLALARKHRKKDPELARRCLERILSLEPKHEEALALLAELGEAPTPKPSRKKAAAGETLIFNGADLDHWTGTGKSWDVVDGVLVGSAVDAAYFLRSKELLEGDYVLEVEARFGKDQGETPRFAVRFGMKSEFEAFSLNCYAKSFSFDTYEGEEGKKLDGVDHWMFSDSFDRKAWTKIRIEVKGKRVVIKVNQKKVFEHEVTDQEKPFDGYPGLIVQSCVVEFRRVARVE